MSETHHESMFCYGCDRYVDSFRGIHPEYGPTEFCPLCGESSVFLSEADFYRNRIDMIRGSYDNEALKVPSSNGHHWVRYDMDSEEFRAVYAGPHGPENAEATIDHANIMTLLHKADEFEIVFLERVDNPFDEPEVAQ